MHLGSLVAALGSYLEARAHGGRWLVRIEDLDAARNVPGCAEHMLRVLDAFGLHWDGVVEYQSRRTAYYAAALAELVAQGLTYECSCSRRQRGGGDESGYPGTCRNGPTRAGPTATRFRVTDATIRFVDGIQGACEFSLGRMGDVVIRRRDGLHAYQLAVVVDDAAQAVTHVVRGADLLQSTPWQIELGRALGVPRPAYSHLPLVVEPNGAKLAKSRHSVPLEARQSASWLVRGLRLLRHEPPPELLGAPVRTVLEWATTTWSGSRLAGMRSVAARSDGVTRGKC